MANVVDLSDQEARREALRASEDRARRAQEGGHVGVWEWDIATGEMYWSQECERLYGFTAQTPRRFEEWRKRIGWANSPCRP